MRKNVLEYLESSARMHADKPAFCDENRVFTFGELLKAAQGLGTHLAKTVDTLHKPVAVLIGRTAESVAAMQEMCIRDRHDHIRDTCIPTFIAFNIPIMICAILMSQVL